MKKRFIIATDSSKPEQETALTQFLRDQGVGWWHWLSNIWLVVDSKGNLAAAGIRDALKETHPAVHALVIELSLTDDTWAGFGPSGTDKNMFKWIRENWKRT